MPLAEFQKAKALFAVARSCGFVAPEPISYQESPGQLTLRFIEGLEPIRNHYLAHISSRHPRREHLRLFHEAGRVLGSIHAGLRCDDADPWVPSPSFRDAYESWAGSRYVDDMNGAPTVAIHCDYGFSNVCVVAGDDAPRIAVIDPSPNGFVTFGANLVGPVYVDLANFMACIEGLVPLRHYTRARWSRLEALRVEFLSGYASAAWEVDRRVLEAMAYATASSYFGAKFGNGIRSRLALLALFNNWKGNDKRFNA